MTKPDHIRVILETGHGDDWTRLYIWEGDTDLGPTLDLWQRIVRLLSEPGDDASEANAMSERLIRHEHPEAAEHYDTAPHEGCDCRVCQLAARIAELEVDAGKALAAYKYQLTVTDARIAELHLCRQRVAELEAREHAVNETQTGDALDTIRTLCEERARLQADLRAAAERYLDAMRDLGAAKARIEELENIVGWDGDKILAVVQERNAAKARIAELER